MKKSNIIMQFATRLIICLKVKFDRLFDDARIEFGPNVRNKLYLV